MAVEKNPVTILQEMEAKIGSVPIYELCPSELLTVPPIFTFKVSCDGLTAYGSGKSKKGAKQNAAKNMIEKMGQLNIVMNPAAAASARDNSIQELMKLCNKLQLEEPIYKELERTGPPHAPVYSTLCTVSKFQQNGTARTKRQSKQIAASKMIDQLKDTFSLTSSPPDNGNKRIKTGVMDDNADTIDFSQVNAIDQASKLKINYQLKMESKRKELFKNLSSSSVTFTILLSNLQEMSDLIQECQLNCSSQKITKLKQMFQNVMDTAKIDFHHMLLQTADPATFMLIIQLNIVPDVIEMSIGKTREEAEWRTISKIVGSLKELLN